MTRLDRQIEKDLTDLYYGLDMSDAAFLNKNGIVKDTYFSTRGLPLHFTGDRNAQTVFVMLNPGEDACVANCMFNAKTALYNRRCVNDFIDSYKKDKTKVAISRMAMVDSFDLKQAFFLKPWQNSGILFPAHFPICRCTHWDATENVLNQKLQLELLPYNSSSFGPIDRKGLDYFIPFLEVLFDEISSTERKYVIFGSSKYESLFKYYNGSTKKNSCLNNIVIGNKCTKSIKTINNKTISVSCIPVEVSYYCYEFNAIIACSFPNHALATSFPLMQQYGEFCYDEYPR